MRHPFTEIIFAKCLKIRICYFIGTHFVKVRSSYIVEGLGNPLSFMSCSHGAGRIMSRTEAVKTLNLAEEIHKLDEKGIVHAIRSQEDLEEASAAYKDIELVMAQESDLVKIKTHLLPIAVIKG